MSCVVDILAGVLTGFGYGAVPGRPNFGHYVAAYSIDAFTDVQQFKHQMDEWVQMMNSTRPAPGHDRVIVAGQPEAEVEAERREEGIPATPGCCPMAPRHLRGTWGHMPVLTRNFPLGVGRSHGVPGSSLLVGVGYFQDDFLGEGTTPDLKANGQSLRVEAAVDRNSRSARQIERTGHHRN